MPNVAIVSGFSILANPIRCYNSHLFCCLHCSIPTGLMCAFQVTAFPMTWGQFDKNVPSSPFLCWCVEELTKLHKLSRPVDINWYNHIDAPQILDVNLNWFGDIIYLDPFAGMEWTFCVPKKCTMRKYVPVLNRIIVAPWGEATFIWFKQLY